MSVQIISLPKLNPSAAERVTAGGKSLLPTTLCSGYKLAIGQKLAVSGEITLLKIPPDPSVTVNEVLPGVALSADSDQQLWQRYNAGGAAAGLIEEAFRKLPPDTLAVAIEERNVVCFWMEKAKAETGQVETIRAVLGVLRDDLQQRFAIH